VRVEVARDLRKRVIKGPFLVPLMYTEQKMLAREVCA
jgi:hypothetical protein